MPRFDAPPSSSSRLGALCRTIAGVLSRNPGVILATLFPTLLAVSFATALVGLAVAVPTALRGAFTASPILVFVSPTIAHDDVQALGARLKALPMVADATLRSKEDALAALIQSGLPPPADGRNPLPDVWSVRLRLDAAQRGDPNFVSVAVGARDAIAALPTVDRVKFDEGWANALDRWWQAWSMFGSLAVAGGLVLATAGVYCLFALCARALEIPEQSGITNAKSALAIMEAIMFCVCGILVYATCRWAVNSSSMAMEPILNPIAGQIGLTLASSIVSTASLGLLTAWVATAFVRLRA